MIGIIDYNCGNIASVCYILDKLNLEYIVTNDKKTIGSCDKVIFPGVGNAKYAMEQLERTGLVDTLKNYKKPFLGICLGMQLLFDYSEEGDTQCLGIIPGKVKKFIDESGNYRIPHIGWNTIGLGTYYYFVHSYFIPICDYTTSICNYINDFSASVQYNNFYGVQFHPEKSSDDGLNFLRRWIEKT